jgi:anti-sigma factor RsiW
MMFSHGKPVDDDQQLVQYLLGALPEDETGQLDELSITDDEFAWRLNAVENDLVDAYVRGELPPAARERFEAAYLSSQERREKVAFAEALVSRKAGAVAAGEKVGNVRRWSAVTFPKWQWAVASLFLLLAASGFLFYDNWRLRRELVRQTGALSAARGRARDLEQLIAGPDMRPSEAPSKSSQRSLNTAAFVLVAQTRDAHGIDTIAIPSGTDRVILQLELESDDFPEYSATVRDPATNQVVWRASGLKAGIRQDKRAVSIGLPRILLKPQHYTVELTGMPAAGASAFAGSYAFRVAE